MNLREATPEENASWESDWTSRLEPGNRQAENRARAIKAPVYMLEADGETVGALALTLVKAGESTETILTDVLIDPAHRRKGHARAALALALAWGREQGSRALNIGYRGDDPAAEALFGEYKLIAQHMGIDLDGKRELPAGIVAEPLTGAAYDEWHEHSVVGYAEITAASSFGTYEEAYERSVREFGELLPQGPDTPGHSLARLTVDGETVATIWVKHGYQPDTSFVFDVESSAEHRGKGYGRAAMWHGENLAMAAGDGRMMLNVHGHNSVAINLYAKLGYEVVRRYRGADLTA
ncbi:GNAT family N-acetyltransferase [Phytomonospora sp. NPDC050363]|uniref:GNAT family N-acetyltransferase n=1 Tax=Phytomonospora sp. NPDC050363 TaxID=3155642 RepID=UPI00340405D9